MTKWLFSIGSAFLFIMTLLILCTCSFGQDEDGPNFKPLLTKWISNADIPTGRVSLTTFRKATKSDDGDDVGIISYLDLDRQGSKEIAIRTGCAAVGNCQLDVFTKIGKSYRRLVSEDMVQTIRPLSTTSHGYRDLDFGVHGTAYETYHKVFKFNGSRYKQSYCWNEEYSYLDKRGNLNTLKKPKITRGCTND
jgi:hypothetical protein